MKKKPSRENVVDRTVRETRAAMMRGEPLAIKGRDDLKSATKRLEYDIATRIGKLYLSELCTVDYSGCIRLFIDIDPDVKRIEVFSGKVLDGVYERKKWSGQKSEWQVSGFPYRGGTRARLSITRTKPTCL